MRLRTKKHNLKAYSQQFEKPHARFITNIDALGKSTIHRTKSKIANYLAICTWLFMHFSELSRSIHPKPQQEQKSGAGNSEPWRHSFRCSYAIRAPRKLPTALEIVQTTFSAAPARPGSNDYECRKLSKHVCLPGREHTIYAPHASSGRTHDADSYCALDAFTV